MDNLSRVTPLLASLGLKKLFYFNRGEPFMSSRIDEELKTIRADNPDLHICTSTNGTLLNSDAKRDAALQMNEVEFSIDGCDQKTLQRYQKGGSFERSYKNMKALVQYRDSRDLKKPIIEWKYVVFNWNDRPEHIQKAIALAKDAGVDYISFWPTNSPFYGISLRYKMGKLNNIGQKSWKGREVWFTERDTP
jgi:MoaA/NifB/PqqE/SkfB family radical SAM enzyme